MIMMKWIKGISFFLLYPLLLLGIGFYTGVKTSHFFYSDGQSGNGGGMDEDLPSQTPEQQELQNPEILTGDQLDYDVVSEEGDVSEDDYQETAVTSATLCVDTKYVLEETDVLNHTVVETTQRLPNKYVGMNREQFVQAMETYESAPPLSELERGFVSLEILAFSRERVVVQKNYKFLQPGNGYYLAVYDNEVVVYQEDRETIYIETHIMLDSLPVQLQERIIDMMWIEDEEELYSFLENYSS